MTFVTAPRLLDLPNDLRDALQLGCLKSTLGKAIACACAGDLHSALALLLPSVPNQGEMGLKALESGTWVALRTARDGGGDTKTLGKTKYHDAQVGTPS